MKNFAMLGKWHVHAPGYAREINALEDCQVTKVWDADEAQGKAWAEELGCAYASIEEILADSTIEGVVICNATNEHTNLIIRACEAGKAVFTEKVLALTSEEAAKVKEAVLKNNTRFAISYPHFSEPGTQFSLAAALEGKLGQINYARVRKAHNGATGNWLPPHFYDPVACGGGAMIDLGAHPMYLLCAIMNDTPVEVQSAFTEMTGHGVEDNAVSLLRFKNGAIGVSETSFVSCKYPFTIELGGTEGSLLQRNQEVSYACAETDYNWVNVEKLPDRLPSPIVQWALADQAEDIPEIFGIDVALRLTKVMEMAYAQYK
ncbi:MAG: Gfo/Idh/MocA family oxidoreductase [Clostridiales bacterium]|nr:Gfo/Idh/MocA family oxidoreductase [Clostridiales bacterium]